MTSLSLTEQGSSENIQYKYFSYWLKTQHSNFPEQKFPKHFTDRSNTTSIFHPLSYNILDSNKTGIQCPEIDLTFNQLTLFFWHSKIDGNPITCCSPLHSSARGTSSVLLRNPVRYFICICKRCEWQRV